MQLLSMMVTAESLQVLMALAIASTALPLLWPTRPGKPPPTRAQQRQISVHRAALPVADTPPRPRPLVTIQPEAAFARVATVIEATGDRVRDVHGATLAASRHIDNAELALLRLVREAAPFMATPLAFGTATSA